MVVESGARQTLTTVSLVVAFSSNPLATRIRCASAVCLDAASTALNSLLEPLPSPSDRASCSERGTDE